MKTIFKQLQHIHILSTYDIQIYKLKLVKSHNHLTFDEQSFYLNKYIHTQLNKALFPLTGSLLKILKCKLLDKVKGSCYFTLTAFDIFEVYSKDKDISLKYLKGFTLWLNYSLKNTLTSKEVQLLITSYRLSLNKAHGFYIRRPIYLIIIGSLLILATQLNFSKEDGSYEEVPNLSSPQSLEPEALNSELHPEFRYKEINQEALKKWLHNRHSILANEPYFSDIIHTSQAFNINPLLLFAITGQEQNFVPTQNKNAKKIVNNPFNVYGSWEIYNTSLEETSKIAARTLIHLGKGCPEDEDQVKWINRKYAEDPNWYKGVNYFFKELETISTPVS